MVRFEVENLAGRLVRSLGCSLLKLLSSSFISSKLVAQSTLSTKTSFAVWPSHTNTKRNSMLCFKTDTADFVFRGNRNQIAATK
ncbi:hypothetical protein RHMOL_Rhmol10G0043400 [Rhododendron molle]|uniref:Uncharacterized protein n=1 Tax=Rhododendron molle TaxID=49168 RepID=A0ACC0LYU6_RHOML|nr:hypothetical protein RHMOL_Rhmol10G0043400 [Rhododendron molle]